MLHLWQLQLSAMPVCIKFMSLMNRIVSFKTNIKTNHNSQTVGPAVVSHAVAAPIVKSYASPYAVGHYGGIGGYGHYY